MYNPRPAKRGTDGGATNRRGRNMSMTGTTVITVTWEGRIAWTASSHLPVTWGGRTALTAGSHTPITITIRRLIVDVVVVAKGLVEPVGRTLGRRGPWELSLGLFLIVHGHSGLGRLGGCCATRGPCIGSTGLSRELLLQYSSYRWRGGPSWAVRVWSLVGPFPA